MKAIIRLIVFVTISIHGIIIVIIISCIVMPAVLFTLILYCYHMFAYCIIIVIKKLISIVIRFVRYHVIGDRRFRRCCRRYFIAVVVQSPLPTKPGI